MINKDDVFFTFNRETIDAISVALTGKSLDSIAHSQATEESYIMHVGQLYRSGRFPWGSGVNPFQRHGSFSNWHNNLKSMGLSDKEIADEMGISVVKLRSRKQEMNEFRRYSVQTEVIPAMKERGYSDQQIADMLNDMGKEYGFSTNRQTVKNWQDATRINKDNRDINDVNVLRDQIKAQGYLDVGKGVEVHLGMTRNRLDSLVKRLSDEEGIYLHNNVQVAQMSNPDQKTTFKVLSTEPDRNVVRENPHLIKLPENVRPVDGALENMDPVRAPELISRDRIAIRYGDADINGDAVTGSEQDGIMEVRRGAEGLDMGNSRYAQVRIGVKGADGRDMYMKGMAIYRDDMPDGVDIIYNTNRPQGTPDLQPAGVSGQEVFKKMKGSDGESANHRFGAVVKPGGQRGYLNVLAEEGNWAAWSKNLSTQFLSKQPIELVNERLDATRQDYMKELEQINSLTNEVVKQKMLEDFSGRMVTASQHMKAKSMPNQLTHVIMPVPQMAENQVYAPNYPNGTRLALVRFPHGAKFEIPDLVVNNSNRHAKNLLGNARDALGIHPKVADQLSGADFDGDTVVAIPNNNRQIALDPAVREVIDFDSKFYRDHNMPESRRMKNTQMQMGMVSNLITDMTVQGAPQEEIIRAVKHSMVVIDAEKHVLDYRRSEQDHGIPELKRKYQRGVHPITGKVSVRGSAATLFSRSGDSTVRNPNYNPNKATNNNPNDRNYNPFSITLAEWARNQPGGAQNLVSLDGGTEVEQIYASHSNNTMGISRQAQADADRIILPGANRRAAQEYAAEVQSLTRKLNAVQSNKPLERAALLRANNSLRARDTDGLDKKEMKKLRNTLMREAREAVGAKSQQITITDREWEAIQARAMPPTNVRRILDNADMEQVIERSMPRQGVQFSESQMVRMRQMHQQGRTWGDIAQIMNTSVANVVDLMGERNPELFENDDE